LSSHPAFRLSLLATLAVLGCTRWPREPLVTYYSAEHGVSLRHPSSWKTEQAEQDGFWYRYFLAPPQGPNRLPAVSVTLLAGSLEGSVDDYARSYLAGNTLSSARDEERGPARGRVYRFGSPDGAKRYSLMLLKEQGRVIGLYAQGEAPLFERHAPVVDEVMRSLTFERPAAWPEQRNQRFGFALRVPESWQETRSFSGGGTFLQQFRSPALGADRDREPVHASLGVTVEPLPRGGDLDSFYETTREKLGDAFQILSHTRWRDGFADAMRTETQLTTSRIKRFYRVADGRGVVLSCEAREDVYPRASRWCDQIAATLRVGDEMKAP
jgi:hypothetical protein